MTTTPPDHKRRKQQENLKTLQFPEHKNHAANCLHLLSPTTDSDRDPVSNNHIYSILYFLSIAITKASIESTQTRKNYNASLNTLTLISTMEHGTV